MSASVLDRSDLDTWLALLLLREGQLPRETLRALLDEARSNRPQGGSSLARSLVQFGLFSADELEALLPQATVAPPSDRPPPQPPQRRLGEYELLDRLGAGGMGTVYRARNVRSGAIHALKTLPATDPELVARFLREGEGQARAGDHPNVVKVHTLGNEQGVCFLVMDLVEGGTLGDRLKGELPPPDVTAGWIVDLARAIQHAHEQGVLHRDLKPENVLFEGDLPKLVDFGLAKLVDARSLTETGTVLGTPGYMAPEQVDSSRGSMSPATDVYGLGALLYRCLTGRAPFAGGALMVVLLQVLEEEPPPPRSLRPEVSSALEAICLRALAKEPQDRYPTAAAFGAAVEEALASPNRAAPPSLRLAAWVAGAATLLALGLIAALASERARAPDRPAQARPQDTSTAPPNALPSGLPATTPGPAVPTGRSGPPSAYLRSDPHGLQLVANCKNTQDGNETLREVLERPRSVAHGTAYFTLAKRHRNAPALGVPALVRGALAGDVGASAVLGILALPRDQHPDSYGVTWSSLELRACAERLEIQTDDWDGLAIACFVLAIPRQLRGDRPSRRSILSSAPPDDRPVVRRFLRDRQRRALPTFTASYRRVQGAFPRVRLPEDRLRLPPPRPSASWSMRRSTPSEQYEYRRAWDLFEQFKRVNHPRQHAEAIRRLHQVFRSRPSQLHGRAYFLLAQIQTHQGKPDAAHAALLALARAALRGHWKATAVLALLGSKETSYVREWGRLTRPAARLKLAGDATWPAVEEACRSLALSNPDKEHHSKVHGQLERWAKHLHHRQSLSPAEAYQTVWSAFPAAQPFE